MVEGRSENYTTASFRLPLIWWWLENDWFLDTASWGTKDCY